MQTFNIHSESGKQPAWLITWHQTKSYYNEWTKTKKKKEICKTVTESANSV